VRIGWATALVAALAACSPAPSRPAVTSTSDVAAFPGIHVPLDTIANWVDAGIVDEMPGRHTVTQTYQTPISSTPTTTIDLGSGVVFVSPTRKIRCVADDSIVEPLACNVRLKNPPPTPDGNAPMRWWPNWVHYFGDSARIGAYQGGCSALMCAGDSDGPVLGYGQKVSWNTRSGAFSCRMDRVGVVCVNMSKGSAMLLNEDGISPYGCLKLDPDDTVGIVYKC